MAKGTAQGLLGKNELNRRVTTRSVADDRIEVAYVWCRRAEWVAEALTLQMGSERHISLLDFYSSNIGVVRWTAAHGFGPLRTWETTSERGSATGYRGSLFLSFIQRVRKPSEVDALVERVMRRDLPGRTRSAVSRCLGGERRYRSSVPDTRARILRRKNADPTAVG